MFLGKKKEARISKDTSHLLKEVNAVNTFTALTYAAPAIINSNRKNCLKQALKNRNLQKQRAQHLQLSKTQ
jgi:hypothetical protein